MEKRKEYAVLALMLMIGVSVFEISPDANASMSGSQADAKTTSLSAPMGGNPFAGP
jgi:hypothetical protein